MKKRLLGLLLAVVMAVGMIPTVALADSTAYTALVTSIETAYAGNEMAQEWENIGLKDVAFAEETRTAAAQTAVDALTAEAVNASDVMKAVLTLCALGYDPADITTEDGSAVDGYAVLNGCADATAPWYFWTAPYVLLALGDNATEAQVDAHVQCILAGLVDTASLDSWGFSADGRAMGLIGLAPYCAQSAVKTQVELTVAELEAGIAAMPSGKNTNANAMIVLAYTMLGKDPTHLVYSDGVTVVDDLMSARLADGSGLVYGTETTINASATKQGLVALKSFISYEETETAVNPFDLSASAVNPLDERALAGMDTEAGDFTVAFSVQDDENRTWFAETVAVNEGDTVKDAFDGAMAVQTAYTAEVDGGTYVKSITHPTYGTYGEFTNGARSGWKYQVNGVSPADIGFSKYALSEGDAIVFYFVADYAQETQPFDDVAVDSWYCDAVNYVVDAGLFAGTGDRTFDPSADMTRAMVWTVLARNAGEDTTTGESWYQAGMAWAMENAVSDGTNPAGNVTREQLAAMLYRDAGAEAVTADLSAYDDLGAVSDWAVEAMAWAVSSGIISGRDATTLAPQSNATRAEVATMMMRYLQSIAD